MLSRLFLACLILLSVIFPAAARAPGQKQIDDASQSIVMIEAEGPTGRITHGAGFVFDASGRIATLWHVVDGARAIRIAFSDGRKATARVRAKDGPFDLALLDASIPVNVPPLPIETAPPEKGARVIAIGNPFGHGFSASAGIVSGHDRTVDPVTPHGFLQHDAALNPGSSGGPLLDAHYRLIGINAAIPNGRRSDVGVGFAIPAAIAARVLNALAANGAIGHGHLGARLRLVDSQLASALGESAGSIAIEEVEDGGPAQRAGARAGDILRMIDGTPLAGLRQIADAVTGSEPGRNIVLTGVRSGQPLRLDVTLGAAPGTPEPGRAAAAPADAGFAFGSAGEPVVKFVARGSAAAAAGLKTGDVVLAIGPHAVSNAQQAATVLKTAAGGPIALLVKRNGLGARYVVLTGQADPLAGSPLEGNREIETSLPF